MDLSSDELVLEMLSTPRDLSDLNGKLFSHT